MTKSSSKNIGNDSWFSMCTYMDCNNISTQGLASFWFNQFCLLLYLTEPHTNIVYPSSKDLGFFFQLCFYVALSRVTRSFTNIQPIALHRTLQSRCYYPHFTAAEQRHRAASTITVKKCPLIPVSEISLFRIFILGFSFWVSGIVIALFTFKSQLKLTSVTAVRTQQL